MAGRFFVLILCAAIWIVDAQLPPSGTLSDGDGREFRAEVARIEKLLVTASDKDTVMYQMARTWGAAKQWPEAMKWLQKVADRKVGIDPGRDSIFGELRGTREFGQIEAAVREATTPVSRSSRAFRIKEGDLTPENLAYDPQGKQFYFGSMRKGEVLRCSAAGDCERFAGGLGVVLGLKVRGNGLWLLNNSDKESALLHYDLRSGSLVHKYATGAGHNFNDLAFASGGDVYVTDTRAGAVWHLKNDSADLTKLPGKFEAANGIAMSPNGRLLYVSTFGDGISVVDLQDGIVVPIGHPSNLCLATIDGLYFHRGSLIAIQNGFMTPRVVRFVLRRDLRAIERFDVLERRNPLFDGVTTGVIVDNDLFYMANIQDEKKSGFDPITVLKLHLN